MNWLESLIYGLVSGLAEFLPISLNAHQVLLRQMFDVSGSEPLRDLIVHIALLAALLTCCRTMFAQLRREQKKASRSRRRYGKAEVRSRLDMRLVKTAAFAMIVGFFIFNFIGKETYSLGLIALLMVLNGIILYLPERLMHGNKDARSMSALDALLIGLISSLSVFPGISRVGAATSVAISRGAEKQHAFNWALLLSVPALLVLIVLNIITLATQGLAGISAAIVAAYFLSAIAAYCGGYLGIVLMRYMTVRLGFSGFAYYSWGAALFSIILSLIV